jgi:hypothetical protein
MTIEADEGKKPSSKIKLTLEHWFKVKSRYLAGDVVAAIARDYKISRQTIWTKAKREGWKHGSRKEAIAEKIAAEVEGELIVEYKVAVKEANKKHFKILEECLDSARNLLEAANIMLNDKIGKLKKFKEAGVHIPDGFSILEEVRVIAAASRSMLSLIGRTESEILGIVDKPMLVEDTANKGLSEMSRVIREAAEKYSSVRTEEREKIRAEVMAEIKGTQTGNYPLQS